MFTRLPFGINCAPDYFSAWFAEIFKDLEKVIVHIDDVLIHTKTREEHEALLTTVFDRLEKAGLTLNKEKCRICVTEIEFLGHVISEKGIKMNEKRASAIAECESPKDKSSLMHFLGIVNYVGKFIPNKSDVLEPLNSLLKGDTQFVWTDVQERAFQEIKRLITNAPILAHYDYRKTIIVQADASGYGLGAALLQESEEKVREVVAYTSKTLTDCEKRYSQIEKEALALAFACEHFKEFIIGIDIKLETDHKPLIQILQTKPLDDLTPRLQRIRMRLMRYNYSVEFVPGKQLILADGLSRLPSNNKTGYDDDLPKEIYSYVRYIVAGLPATSTMLDRIKDEQQQDYICSTLIRYSQNGWPKKSNLDEGLLPYFASKDYISYASEYLLYKARLIIPSSLQLEMLNKIHSGHLGLNKCRARARQSVWWIGLSSQLKNVVEFCPKCIEHRANHKEPFLREEFPCRPWQKIGLDLFKWEKWYLIITDYYSRYIEVYELSCLTQKEVIRKCQESFARFGIPEIVRSDCGT